MSHLFLTSSIATKLWRLFADFAGIQIEGLQLSQVCNKWWTSDCCSKLKPLLRVAPAIVTWNLWKRRNRLKHGKSYSYNSLVSKVNSDLRRHGRTTYAGLKIPTTWPNIIDFLEKHTPRVHYIAVSWKPPKGRLVKCSAGGASKGNPGRSTYGFCLRECTGDLVYAQGEEIQESTNLEAEAIAIREAITHCITVGMNQVCLETDSLI